MAYQFPLNGGRINASVGGNSTSAGAGYSLISTGTMLLAGGNNITLSQNGGAITISGANVQGGVALFDGVASISSGTARVVAAGALTASINGQTLSLNAPAQSSLYATGAVSLSSNGSSVSIGAPAQSNQTLGFMAGTTNGGNTSLTSTGSFDARSMYLNAHGAISAGFSNSSLFISSPVQSSYSLSGNGITFNTNGSTVSASVATTYAASNHSHGNPTLALTNLSGTTASASNGLTLSLSAAAPGGGGVALSAGGNLYSSGTVSLSPSGALTISSVNATNLGFTVPAQSSLSQTGIVSISRNGSTISIGAPAFSAGISGGNTTGSSGTASNQLVFAGGNNITLSQVTGAGGNTVTISGAPVFDAGVGGAVGGSTYGNTGTSLTGGLQLYAGNNIGLSQSTDANNNAIVTIMASGGSGGGIALSNSQSMYSSGTVGLVEGSGAISIGTSTSAGGGQSYNISVQPASSISATGAVSISTAGNTVFIGAPVTAGVGGSAVRWEYPNQVFNTVSTIPNGTLSLQHVYIPFNISVRSARIAASISANSLTTSGITATQSMSLYMGIYTLNGSTLSQLYTSSNNNSFSYSSAAAGVAMYNGIKELTTPMSINLTPGEYWIGAMLSSSSSNGTSFNYTIMGNSLISAGASIGVLGSSINQSNRDVFMGQGLYATAAMPSSVAVSAITNTANGYAQRAAFYHVLYNTTY